MYHLVLSVFLVLVHVCLLVFFVSLPDFFVYVHVHVYIIWMYMHVENYEDTFPFLIFIIICLFACLYQGCALLPRLVSRELSAIFCSEKMGPVPS